MALGFVSWSRKEAGFAQDPQAEGSHLPRDQLEDRQQAVSTEAGGGRDGIVPRKPAEPPAASPARPVSSVQMDALKLCPSLSQCPTNSRLQESASRVLASPLPQGSKMMPDLSWRSSPLPGLSERETSEALGLRPVPVDRVICQT